MTHPMHPRSSMTFTIFVTTLLASFVVVGLPHMLPCPAPRVAYAEGELGPDGKRRRRRRCVTDVATDGSVKGGKGCEREALRGGMEEELEVVGGKREGRDCPIPKPGGVVGEILGFGRTAVDRDTSGVVRRPPS